MWVTGRQETTSAWCLSSWRMHTRSCRHPTTWLWWCKTQVLMVIVRLHVLLPNVSWQSLFLTMFCFWPCLSLLVSSLTLTPTPALTRHINTDIDMKCSVTSAPSASSRYAVTWTLLQPAQNMTIVRSDRDSLVTYGPNLEVSYKQRISTRRTEGPSFELTVRQTRLSDKGSYLCEVIEWRRDPLGEWYQLSPVSGTTELTLIEPGKVTNSLKKCLYIWSNIYL